jgi:hypothetical protein
MISYSKQQGVSFDEPEPDAELAVFFGTSSVPRLFKYECFWAERKPKSNLRRLREQNQY